MPGRRLRWLFKKYVLQNYLARTQGVVLHPAKLLLSSLRLLIAPGNARECIALKNGLELYLSNFMSIFIFDEIFVDDCYRINSLSAPRVIVDVGANTGYFSLAASYRWPDARIMAFEPEPSNAKLLRLNLCANQITNVQHYEMGVTDTCGCTELFKHPGNVGAHSLYFRDDAALFGRRRLREKVNVRTVSLNWIISQLDDDEAIDLLKIDCEGCEKDILFGLSEETAQRIRNLVFEPDARLYKLEEAILHLESLGYSVEKSGELVFASRT